MARPKNITPAYVRHTASGRGRLVWTDVVGVRHDKLLPGLFGSEESLQAKAVLELQIASSATKTVESTSVLSVAELLAAYYVHAEKHYRGTDGKKTSKFTEVKLIIRALRELFAEIPVTDFTPLRLKAVRQKWVDDAIVRVECN